VALATLTRLHRRDLAVLTGEAKRDLEKLWREFSTPVAARDVLARALPQLVAIYGAAAATLGADYFDEVRDEAAARGRFRAAPVEPVTGEPLEVLARVAVGPLFGATPNQLTALTLAQGGLQRHIANADRETVRLASIEDKQAQGWMRVGDGGCDWCQQYLDGEVHYVEGYDFDAHDHCNCTAQPVFG
jgi:hypothetical protein